MRSVFPLACGFTGGLPANLGGISIIALLMSTATGLRSLACASKPSRCASSGRAPPPANGSWNDGSLPRSKISTARGWSAFAAHARRQLCQISSRARCNTASLVVFSHRTSSLRIPNSRSRSSCAATASRVGSGSVNAVSSDCPPDNACLASCSASRFFSTRFAVRFLFVSDSSTSTYSDGSSTIWAKMIARAAASGLRAHHRCRVLG